MKVNKKGELVPNLMDALVAIYQADDSQRLQMVCETVNQHKYEFSLRDLQILAAHVKNRSLALYLAKRHAGYKGHVVDAFRYMLNQIFNRNNR